MKHIVGATPAQVRQETGLRSHPTFNELVAQYQEGGPKIPWNDDPELILRSPAIAELTGMASAADDRMRDQIALAQRNYYIRQEAHKQGLDFHTVRNHMDDVASWADHDKPMHDDEWEEADPRPPPPGVQSFNIGTPRASTKRREQAQGMDPLYQQQLRQQAAQMQQHSAATNRWLEQLLRNVEAMGQRHAEQTRAMNELSARQNTLFDQMGRRMGEARQVVEETERQRVAREEQRFQSMLQQVGRLANRQGEQNQNMEIMRMIQAYLAEHARSTASAGTTAAATTSALSDRLGAIEASLQGMGNSVAQGSQGVLLELKKALAEHRDIQRADLAKASAQASTVTNMANREMAARIDRLEAEASQRAGAMTEHLNRLGAGMSQMRTDVLNAGAQASTVTNMANREMQARLDRLQKDQEDTRQGVNASLAQQRQAQEAHKEVLKAFQTLNENIYGVGAETVGLIAETKDAVTAAQAGMETLNSQQQQQAQAAQAMAQQQQAMLAQSREEFYQSMGQLSDQHQQVLMGLMAVLQDPRVIQMNSTQQLNVLQQTLQTDLTQVQREVLLALASNRPIQPEALNYLLGSLDNSETSQLLKTAAVAQQSQLALEDLKMPGADPPTEAQTPSAPSGLGPKLPDGSRPTLGILRPADASGLRQTSPPARSPSLPPAVLPPQRGRERPSVAQSRSYAKHTAEAVAGKISLREARSRSIQDRNTSIIERSMRRQRSMDEDTMKTEEVQDTTKKARIPSLNRSRTAQASNPEARAKSIEYQA